jgi:hypothetical protein
MGSSPRLPSFDDRNEIAGGIVKELHPLLCIRLPELTGFVVMHHDGIALESDPPFHEFFAGHGYVGDIEIETRNGGVRRKQQTGSMGVEERYSRGLETTEESKPKGIAIETDRGGEIVSGCKRALAERAQQRAGLPCGGIRSRSWCHSHRMLLPADY